MKLNPNFVFGAVLALVFTCFLAGMKDSTLPFVPTLIVSFLVCYPWKIGKNVWSVFGGFNDDGSVYSLFGVVQMASGSAISGGGISLFQYAGDNSFQAIGLCLYQYAEGPSPLKVQGQGVGIAVCMRTRGGSLGQLVGLTLFMECENDNAVQIAGVVLFQRGMQVFQGVGLCGVQISTETKLSQSDDGEAIQRAGLVLYQKANQRAYQDIGLRLFVSGAIKRGTFLTITIFEKEKEVVLA